MKNLFCALMLMSAFAFASSHESDVINHEKVISENLIDTRMNDVELEKGCFNITLSCGATGRACGDDLNEVLDLIILADYIMCELFA